MDKTQIRYVAVRPDGTICGPIGETRIFVKYAFAIGHKRIGQSGDWEDIEKLGYTVRKAEIRLLEE